MDDISFSKRRKNRGYTYLCAGSVICVSLLRAPQYSTFACCLIPVLTLVVLLVMLDDIDDISFTKRRNFLIVSWMSISVYCIPTRDTHITRDLCMGIHISRGYTYHCDTGTSTFSLLTLASSNCNASLGPGSAVREKGKKRGQIGKISASEASPAVSWGGGKGRHSFPFPDYLSTRFARRFFFSRTLIFFSFFPQCWAWSQATVMHMSSACPIAYCFSSLLAVRDV